jgi:hypothetical protein
MSAADADIGLPEALERAASALPDLADAIRPANGDPGQLARVLEADDARVVLAWLLEHEPSSGGELALVWAEDAESAGPVLALSPESLPKPARKALRRALHRLRSRGIEVPAAPAAATVAKLPPMDEAIEEARVTGLDPHGARIIYLATDRAGGGVRLFQVVIDDERGVLELEVFEAGRARARRFLRETEQRDPWPAVATPPASARALIAAAADHQSRDRSAPRAFVEFRSRLCDVPPDTKTPGALAREALGPDADEREGLEKATAWMRDATLGPWPPPRERVQGLIDRLQEIAKGVVIIGSAARDEQIDAALTEALGGIYDAAQRERVSRGLEETAYVWWKAGRESDARSALAAATAFRTLDPAENPVARAMLEVLLRPALERAREGEAPPAEEAAPEQEA